MKSQNLKIRCSSLDDLMGEPKSKADKEAGNLSVTAKMSVLRIWIADMFDKHKEFSSKYTDKGNHCEERGLTMLTHKLGLYMQKNEDLFSNAFINGHPDVVPEDEDFIADIKCPWDLENFMTATGDDYYWQMQGYMWLTGRKRALLAYCLVDAPEWIIEREIRTLLYKSAPDMEDDIREGVRKNLTFDNVPHQSRVRVFEIPFQLDAPALITNKVMRAREYYNNLKL